MACNSTVKDGSDTTPAPHQGDAGTPQTEAPIEILDSLNASDAQGRKQGLWKQMLNGKVWKLEQYKNDQLNGKCLEYQADGTVFETSYKNGVKQGLQLHYAPDSTVAIYVRYYTNNESQWMVYPNLLHRFFVPVKGILIDVDSAYLRVPYNNGSLMYEGAVVHREHGRGQPVGIHKIYYPDGSLKCLLNYPIDSLTTFTPSGEEVEKAQIIRGKRYRTSL